MEDKIKKTDTWRNLVSNPKFKESLDECLKKYSYYTNLDNLIFRIIDDKLIINYNSKIKSSDLDYQYKFFEQDEFWIDQDNNLIVNGLNGRLESDKGFKFRETNGGLINTHYCCNVYDQDGIELDYERYDDKYLFDKFEYDYFVSDFQNVILGAYNPNLALSVNKKDSYPVPIVTGRGSQFTRYIRSIDNLGVVEVVKCLYNKDNKTREKELYFNLLHGNKAIYTPEMIHFIADQPFATFDDSNTINILKEYRELGINENNYEIVACSKFLKDLYEGKEMVNGIRELQEKYNLMIEKLDKKENSKTRTFR